MNVHATLTLEEVIGVLVDRYIQPLLLKVDQMSQQVTILKTALDVLVAQGAATISNENALKAALDAAVADAVSKGAILSTLQDKVTDLQGQLVIAKANAADPADQAALAGMQTTIEGLSQQLADAAARTAPSN